MNKQKLNQPDVETTITTFSNDEIFESLNINITKPTKQFRDIFVSGLTVEKPQQTEQQILKKFEELGYELKVSNNGYLIEFFNEDEMSVIKISKKNKRYIKVDCVYYSGFVPISFQEHQLLHELFKCWGWFDEN